MIKKPSFPVIAVGLSTVFLAGVISVYAFSGSQETGDLFGIPLTPPAFAQEANSEFPDDQAGISSYVQVDPTLIDFDTITPVFDETIGTGENYIIGAFTIPRNEEENGSRQGIIQVRVYVDTDGFIVAYITKDKLAADIFRFYMSDPPADPLDTLLSDALSRTTDAIGTAAPTEASWYHWNYPSATHFSAAARHGVGDMYMQVPANAVYSESPSYSWYSKREDGGGHRTGFLTMEDPAGTITTLEEISTVGETIVQELTSITPGERYRFELHNGTGGADNNFLGLAVIYQIP